MIFLAVYPEGKLARVQEIVDSYGISRGHTMKVVNQLGRIGLIENVRGRCGGMRLIQRPEDLSLADIVRKTEENLALVECFSKNSDCVIYNGCGLKGALHEALDAFFDCLDKYTLADVAAEPRELEKVLQIGSWK